MPGHTKCCTCHAKSSQQTWRSDRSDAPKCNPSQESSARTLMNMSLVLRLPRKMHLCRSSSNVARLPSFLKMLQNLNLHVFLTSDKLHNPFRLPHEATSERPNVVRECGIFNIFTSKCASGVLSKHLNFQKRSGPGVFCTFGLRNVLRATTACFFSSLIWPAGSAPAALASLLFDLPEPQISVSRLSYLFAHLHLLSSETFSFLIFFLLLFSSLLWLFPPLLFMCPYCRKFDF